MSATEAPNANQTKPKLSTGQMLQLMRLEMDKALRHEYAISCMAIGLDGFDDSDQQNDRKKTMVAVFRELKQVCFDNDVRGLGIFTPAYTLAVFPHVTPEKITVLAEQMLERAKALELSEEEDADHDLGLTLSIGVSHNLHAGPKSFESLVQEAEMGMELASGSGGDRSMQAKEVESELDRLREELETQIQEIQEHQDTYFGELDLLEENWGRNLTEKAIALFNREPDQTEGVLRLKKELIGLIKVEVQEWRNSSSISQLLESQKQIGLLERRVTKLTESLGVTEQELQRVAAMKNIDLGVASIYRTVQGLGAEDANGQKGEMLKNIFEANMSLRGRSTSE